MKKYIFSIVLVFVTLVSQAQIFSEAAGGNWNVGTTWVGGVVPTATDFVIIMGDGAGGGTVNITSNVAVGDLYVVNDNTNVLSKGGSLFAIYTLTINGQLGGILFDLSDFAAPTTTVIENDTRLNIVFTNDNANTPNISTWGSLATLKNVSVNPTSAGTTVIFEDLAINASTLDINNGTLRILNGFRVSDATSSSTITIAAGAALDVRGSIDGGTDATNFNDIVMVGASTLTVNINGFINSNALTLDAGSVFNITSNQPNGWWHSSATSPSSGTINANSIVNYNRQSAQGIAARTYGNLNIFSGGVAATKTLSASGTLTVQGDFYIGGSNTFASSNANTIILQGATTNDGSWTTSQPIQFDGGGTQVVNGISGITFNNTVTFSNAMNFDSDITFGSTVSCGSNNMSFARGFTNNGTYNCSGTTTFDGVAAQSIGGSSTTTFTNLTISNTSSTATISGTGSRVLGTLTLNVSSGLNANGLLTLVSDAAGTARTAAIPASAVFSGNVIYQRYINGAQQWHNIGLPISGTTADIISSGYPDPNASLGGDFARYNEAVAGDLNQGWETSKLPFTAIDDMQGYSFWTRTANTPGTLTFVGPLNTGNMSLPVTRTVQNGLADDGWNLVNNPYASQIDWASASWTKTNIDATIYVWNGVAYNSLNGTGTIASGQSFWVHANAGSPVLTATQNVKTSAPATFYRTSETVVKDQLSVTLLDGEVSDLARIRFLDDAIEEFDSKYDGYKLKNDIFNLASTTQAGLDLSINTLPTSTLNRTIKLNVSNISEGSYQLKFDGLSSFDASPTFTLIDNFVNTSTVLEEGFEYNFTVTADTTSYGSSRFSIVVEPQIILGTNETLEGNSTITVYPNPVTQYLHIKNLSKTKINLITIYDLNGKIVYRKTENISHNIDMNSMKKGIYIINIVTDTKTITYRVRKK